VPSIAHCCMRRSGNSNVTLGLTLRESFHLPVAVTTTSFSTRSDQTTHWSTSICANGQSFGLLLSKALLMTLKMLAIQTSGRTYQFWKTLMSRKKPKLSNRMSKSKKHQQNCQKFTSLLKKHRKQLPVHQQTKSLVPKLSLWNGARLWAVSYHPWSRLKTSRCPRFLLPKANCKTLISIQGGTRTHKSRKV